MAADAKSKIARATDLARPNLADRRDWTATRSSPSQFHWQFRLVSSRPVWICAVGHWIAKGAVVALGFKKSILRLLSRFLSGDRYAPGSSHSGKIPTIMVGIQASPDPQSLIFSPIFLVWGRASISFPTNAGHSTLVVPGPSAGWGGNRLGRPGAGGLRWTVSGLCAGGLNAVYVWRPAASARLPAIPERNHSQLRPYFHWRCCFLATRASRGGSHADSGRLANRGDRCGTRPQSGGLCLLLRAAALRRAVAELISFATGLCAICASAWEC